MARTSITTQAMPRIRTLVPWFTQDYQQQDDQQYD
jgi:hypothetical protein